MNPFSCLHRTQHENCLSYFHDRGEASNTLSSAVAALDFHATMLEASPLTLLLDLSLHYVLPPLQIFTQTSFPSKLQLPQHPLLPNHQLIANTRSTVKSQIPFQSTRISTPGKRMGFNLTLYA